MLQFPTRYVNILLGDEGMRKPSHLGFKLFLLAACAAVMGVWALLFGFCPIRAFTGVICPSCGMSRAWLAALRLDLGAAFSDHPMFWIVPAAAALWLFDFQPLRSKRANKWLLVLLGIGFAVCYFVRLAMFLHGDLFI